MKVFISHSVNIDMRRQVDDLVKSILLAYPVETLVLLPASPILWLSRLIVKKGARKEGVGTKVIQDICEFADKWGMKIVLSTAEPSDGLGTTSKARLVSFYKRFGFVHNTGKNKDFTLTGSMYRDPIDRIKRAESSAPSDPELESTSDSGSGIEPKADVVGKKKKVAKPSPPVKLLHKKSSEKVAKPSAGIVHKRKKVSR